jgi:hypothetical protein
MAQAYAASVERSFFEEVRDAFEGFAPEHGLIETRSHRRGLKVWYGDAAKEHYEAQLIRASVADPTAAPDVDGADTVLEVGFHAEHPRPADNEAVLARLLAAETSWREILGPEPQAGAFLGGGGWTRISELWDAPTDGDPDAAMDVAARLADYVEAIEPLRAANP